MSAECDGSVLDPKLPVASGEVLSASPFLPRLLLPALHHQSVLLPAIP